MTQKAGGTKPRKQKRVSENGEKKAVGWENVRVLAPARRPWPSTSAEEGQGAPPDRDGKPQQAPPSSHGPFNGDPVYWSTLQEKGLLAPGPRNVTDGPQSRRRPT